MNTSCIHYQDTFLDMQPCATWSLNDSYVAWRDNCIVAWVQLIGQRESNIYTPVLPRSGTVIACYVTQSLIGGEETPLQFIIQ